MQASLAVGVPDQLKGHPWYLNNDLGTFANTDLMPSVYFGDGSRFIMRDCDINGGSSIYLQVLKERYADLGAVGLVAMFRCDSGLIHSNTNSRAIVGAVNINSDSNINCGYFPEHLIDA